jgi:hypothetical protein
MGVKLPIKKSLSKENQRPADDWIRCSSKNARLTERKHQQIGDGAFGLFFEEGQNPTATCD